MSRYIGNVSAYAYAVEKGYTGTEEEFALLMASYATVGQTAVEAAQTATTKASEASQSATTAINKASEATTAAQTATNKSAEAQSSAQTASTKASEATTAATAAQTAKTQTEAAASQALTDIGAARSSAIIAMETVGETQTENAMAQAQAAATSATTASTKASEASASATSAGQSATEAAASATSAAQSASNAQDVLESIPADYSDLSSNVSQLQADLTTLNVEVEAIKNVTGAKRYGVSGIGQSATTLTRLYDAVGMVAQVGTDGDNSSVVNDFDAAAPFMRRKCVGNWTMGTNGRAVFHVQAYYGETGYAEDGSKGDYVAVECPRSYYKLDGGTLVISAHQYEGFRPFDIFCHDHNPNDTMPYFYLPAYALAVKDGKAVSLPGLDNAQGNYYELTSLARTYSNVGAAAKAILQYAAVNFYEWALLTVEFATTNCQSIMAGCSSLRHDNNDRVTLRSDGKWLANNYYESRVVGEYISIHDATIDINSSAYYASHKITSIIRCDAEGNPSTSGAYQLIETEDLGLGREYSVGSSYRVAARPYRTGDCNGVSSPSGSPVSNANGYYPMKYRWRENVYSNQHKTTCDLFAKRIGSGDDDYGIEWYYLLSPHDYTPSDSSKPDATDLATDAFVKLDVDTAHSNYVNGYTKSKKYSEQYPDIWIPFETSGGSASTFYSDYASLVNSYVVRALRFGGSWNPGSSAGFSSVHAYAAPSFSLASFGGDLFMPQ